MTALPEPIDPPQPIGTIVKITGQLDEHGCGLPLGEIAKVTSTEYDFYDALVTTLDGRDALVYWGEITPADEDEVRYWKANDFSNI